MVDSHFMLDYNTNGCKDEVEDNGVVSLNRERDEWLYNNSGLVLTLTLLNT